MNLKSYAIIAVIVVVAMVIVIKMTKWEGTSVDASDATKKTNVSLKPSFTNKKEA